MDFGVSFVIFTGKEVVHSEAYFPLFILFPFFDLAVPPRKWSVQRRTFPKLRRIATSTPNPTWSFLQQCLTTTVTMTTAWVRISDWSSLFDESDDDDDMSSFTTVSELSDFTWDLFEETTSSTMNLSISDVYDDGVDNYTIAQMLLEQLLNEIV